MAIDMYQSHSKLQIKKILNYKINNTFPSVNENNIKLSDLK